MLKNTLLGGTLLLLLIACNEAPKKMFDRMSSRHTGISFKNVIRETEEFNGLVYGYLYNGGGVAVGDLNQDGLPDIFFTGNLVASKLYINKGNFEFEEISEKAGVSSAGLWNTGTSMVDINGDGWLDIYVCRSAANDPEKRKNLLFINNGNLTFTEQGSQFGLDDRGYTTQASFFDYDLDGDLDAWVMNHSIQEYAGFSPMIGKLRQKTDPFIGNKFYRNENGKFVDITDLAGIKSSVLGFGLGITVSDVNDDGWPDVYIANDYNENDYLFINNKDGSFSEKANSYFNYVSMFSMGCDGADINNDALVDLVTLDMLPEDNYRMKMSMGSENFDKYNLLLESGFHVQTMRNMLQLNNGDGTFSEIGQFAGISNTDWSWATLIADFDNDGWKDIFITNGYLRNYIDMDFMNYLVNLKMGSANAFDNIVMTDLLKKIPAIDVHNYMYQNKGNLTFSNMSDQWGFEEKIMSNGAAWADLDNDGDLDLIVNNINQEAGIYKNNSDILNQNNYLKVALSGARKNTSGVGTKVYAYLDTTVVFQECYPVRGFQSSVDFELLFGVGNHQKIDSLTVVWPGNMKQTLYDVPANNKIILSEADATPEIIKGEKSNQVLFEVVPDNLGVDFKHVENRFTEFNTDRLLPQGLSNLGPAVAVGDLNKDGLIDLYVGGANGSPGKVYLQQPQGRFKEMEMQIFESHKAYEDVSAVFIDIEMDGDLDLYVVSGGHSMGIDSLLTDRIYINDGKANFSYAKGRLPSVKVSSSVVDMADVDLDGDMDLYVGGRYLSGKYPEAPLSYFLLNDGHGFFSKAGVEVMGIEDNVGLVTDVRFCDINGDDREDLVLVGEWMQVNVFENQKGKFVRMKNNGLEDTYGWWNTIEPVDIDRDGDIDLIGGNIGLNNQFKATGKHPVKLVYGDFDSNGKVDPIMTYYIQDKSEIGFSRDELIGQVNSLQSMFPDYQSYTRSSIEDIVSFGKNMKVDSLWATEFHTMLMLNDGKGNFQTIYLPDEAQFSPVYSIFANDVNDDGKLDLILGGNQSATRVSTGHFSTNFGQVFLGNGKGRFTFTKNMESGLQIKGDVRKIRKINIGVNEYFLFFRNNDSVIVYKDK